MRRVPLALLLACGPQAPVELDTTGSSGGASTGPDDDETGGVRPTTGPVPPDSMTTTTTATTTATTTTSPAVTDTGAPEATTTGGSTTASSTSGDVPEGCEEVDIPDPVLLEKVRDRIDVPEGPIPGAEVAALESLSVSGAVNSLVGLQCFTGLRSLTIGDGAVDDLTPVALLPLDLLSVRSSALVDLGPLTSLDKLTKLSLFDVPATDLGPVAGLPLLEELRVSGSAFQDYGPLAGHPTLRLLRASDTAPLDLLPIAAIPNLTVLGLERCGLDDITALAGATMLLTLILDENAIDSLDALNGLGLNSLSATDNLIPSVAPLAQSAALKTAFLGRNEIVDLSPLAGTALESLFVDVNPLSGLEGLEDLPLVSLSAEGAGLTEIVAVAPQTLEELRLAHNAISDVGPIAGHQALRFVDLRDNAVTNLAALQGAPWIVEVCSNLALETNPLDVETLDVILPALCMEKAAISWDQGFCFPDAPRCQLGDP